MSELLRERGYAPASQIATDLAQIEQANKTWGRAVARLRLLEKEVEETFHELAHAQQGQAQIGNGVASPDMSATVAAAWRIYLDAARKSDPASESFRHPPILDWQDP